MMDHSRTEQGRLQAGSLKTNHARRIARPSPSFVLLFIWVSTLAATAQNSTWLTNSTHLPTATSEKRVAQDDWLLQSGSFKAKVTQGATASDIQLDNGLIRRVFHLHPNAATVALDNLMTGESVLRAVKPEAQISLNGNSLDVGGLIGQPEPAYMLPEWVNLLRASSNSFRCVGFRVVPIQERFPWKKKRHSANRPWPPTGVGLEFKYAAPEQSFQGVSLTVHYELYDGMPVLAKWLTLTNGSAEKLKVNSFTSEILAPAEVESAVDERAFRNWRLPAIDMLSDYSFHGMDATTASQTMTWLPDPTYTSQVNYELKMPAMLVSRPTIGPDVEIAPSESFESFRTFVIVHDTDNRERQGLALRRAQSLLAPWATENPIMMHVRSAESKVFRNAVDQCAATGFEMIIYTFGSGLDMENEDPEYIKKVREDVDYAHANGIEVGAYSLLASRRINDTEDVINPKTGKTGGAIFGNSPCLGSRWADNYFRKVRNFLEKTGIDLLEHDGSYPGDLCASSAHPGHQGLNDSQWQQWKRITDLYRWCRAKGIYLNVPDYYFLAGSSKTAMGYRESNWSLPRERQIILGRQNIYDGTWTKGPTMGWMFVPLVEYQGGGAAATLEPLSEHLDAYEAHFINNFAAGVQACFRGPRLYDTEVTREVVSKSVRWFKQHREILESDIIHVRRPDGRDLDFFLHVNAHLQDCAMVVVFNPLNQTVKKTLDLPLYYSGLSNAAAASEKDENPQRLVLDRRYHAQLPVEVPAHGFNWYVFRKTN